MSNHDGIYRHLFAHPTFMRELLLHFTPFAWLAAPPVECFQRVNGSYATERGDQRYSDLVWRIRAPNSGLDVCVQLECQAAPDKWMALRTQVYAGLLLQELLLSRQIRRGTGLPCVVSIVLYHGAAPWRAPRNVAELIGPPRELARDWLPQHRYFLIDQHRLDPALLAASDSLLAQLFRVELSDRPEVVKEIMPTLARWLRQDSHADLKAAVQLWWREYATPQFRDLLDIELTEEDMAKFPRKFDTWYDYVKHEGKVEGKLEGKLEGRLEGEAEGIRIALRDLASARFGSVTQPVSALIDAVSTDQAKPLISALLQSSTPDEVVARMRQAT